MAGRLKNDGSRHWAALPVYLTGFVIDFSVWIYMSQDPRTDHTIGPLTVFVDTLFNLFDILVVLSIFLLARRQSGPRFHTG